MHKGITVFFFVFVFANLSKDLKAEIRIESELGTLLNGIPIQSVCFNSGDGSLQTLQKFPICNKLIPKRYKDSEENERVAWSCLDKADSILKIKNPKQYKSYCAEFKFDSIRNAYDCVLPMITEAPLPQVLKIRIIRIFNAEGISDWPGTASEYRIPFCDEKIEGRKTTGMLK